MEGEQEKPVVSFKNLSKYIPTVIAYHDGAIYVFSLPFAFRTPKGVERRVITNNVSSYYHIHMFKLPFILLVNRNEEISNTGCHKLLYNMSPYNSYKHPKLDFYGVYQIKNINIVKFRAGFRPPVESFDKIEEDYVIGWSVCEGINEIWRLEKLPFKDVEVNLPLEQELEFNTLQGHLQYSPVEVTGEYTYEWMEKIPHFIKNDFFLGEEIGVIPVFKRGRLTIFNHKFKKPVFYLPLPGVYSNPSWVVINTDNVEIESSEHPTVNLQPGTYILSHSLPTGSID